VLLVDDDPSVLKSLSGQLGKTWAVTTAAGASQAMILLDAFDYHAVITDYQTPGQDGIWLLHWVKVRHPHVLRVLVSACEPALFAPHLLSGLVQRHLPKPIDATSMLEALADEGR
jgi:DNA-binding NtrC family response regulator